MPGNYNPQDKYFKKAKAEGYRARSAFKLEEIQSRYHIIKSGSMVLDLGAAPGSFLQYIGKTVGQNGIAIGIDLKPIKSFANPNIKTYEADIFDDLVYKKILNETKISQFDLITSDLAPSTSGIKSLDAGRSFMLNEQVLKVAEKFLRKGGSVLMKAFPGADHSQLLSLTKKQFSNIKIFKPQAVRKTSREIYVLGFNKK
jgi:23S rRNA (uridine2552-2'-O)-methyltransferase